MNSVTPSAGPSGRLACIRIAAPALQVLRRRAAVDEERPLIVTAEDRPSARVLEFNRAAARLGVRVGMRYAQALSLSRSIRAGVVTQAMLEEAMAAVEQLLYGASPAVERWSMTPGVFWVDPRGTGRLFDDGGGWQRAAVALLERDGWIATFARGWTRAGTLVMSAARLAGDAADDIPAGFTDVAVERAWMRTRSWEVLPFEGRDRERLRLLGIATIGAFLDLPEAQLTRRFSSRAIALWHFISADDPLPPQGRENDRMPVVIATPDPPLRSVAQLVSLLDGLVTELVRKTADQRRWIAELTLAVHDEDGHTREERVISGSPTRDAAFLARLLTLRLEHGEFRSAPIVTVAISGVLVEGRMVQESLLDEGSSDRRSDPARLNRAVALLRAELGEEGVLRLAVRSGVLPEDRIDFIPLERGAGLVPRRRADCAVPGAGLVRVRRLMSSDSADAADGSAVAEAAPRTGASRAPRRARDPRDRGRIVRTWGPYLSSSRWWAGQEIQRAYRYQLLESGAVRWCYTEPGSRRRILQGWVE